MLDHIGECLAQSKSVRSLDLTSCASAAKAAAAEMLQGRSTQAYFPIG